MRDSLITGKPWAAGPLEILAQANRLMQKGDDTSKRIAMILIDNSVELAMYTYISLPSKITGLSLPRKVVDDASFSFTKLLDLICKVYENKTIDIKLDNIEWYHRLRNTLYHNGNGLTIEDIILEIYYGIARQLMMVLFDVDIEAQYDLDTSYKAELINNIIFNCSKIERSVNFPIEVFDQDCEYYDQGDLDYNLYLFGENLERCFMPHEIEDIKNIIKIRNEIILGKIDLKIEELKLIDGRLQKYVEKVQRDLN